MWSNLPDWVRKPAAEFGVMQGLALAWGAVAAIGALMMGSFVAFVVLVPVAVALAAVAIAVLRAAAEPDARAAVSGYVKRRFGGAEEQRISQSVTSSAPALADLLAQERLFSARLAEVDQLINQLEQARNILEPAYADKLQLTEDEERRLPSAEERWTSALIGIENAFRDLRQEVKIALVSTGYQPSLHPLRGYGTDTDGDARAARRFWDQATAYSHQCGNARQRAKDELREVKRRLDRMTSR